VRDTLRLITCGSVDDGKSTMIGRLLWDSQQVFEDLQVALEKDSARWGTQGSSLDFALLMDGLQAEREQGITIDVAYRFFATPKRRFIVADSPGHVQYTRNMASGASTSDLAVLVVNAQKRLQIQTSRHARIVSMLGIRHLIMAVNKMDLVDWDHRAFTEIRTTFQPQIDKLGFESFISIPISALHGENLTYRSDAAPWYDGPALLPYLEEIDVRRDGSNAPFRMAVQYVNRPNQNFRGYCGRISSGTVNVGDEVLIAPCGMKSRIKSILAYQQDLHSVLAGESVTLCLEDELDVSRGDVISSAVDPIEQTDQFEANVLSLSEQGLIQARPYFLRIHTAQAVATITRIKCRLDVQEGNRLAASTLGLNEMGIVNVSLDRVVSFEPYDGSRRLGSFILVDCQTNQTVGAGMISHALRRADNVHWQELALNKRSRASQKGQRPVCLWFTGLSASGKSTIANLLEQRLFALGKHTYLLDGDNIRHGLCRDLGFTEVDRIENIRRVCEVARLMVDAGLIVLVSFISPYRSEREFARKRFRAGEFYEIFVDAPLEECERRDPKGLYAKARRGELINFTGIDSAYEPPIAPDLRLETVSETPEECVRRILGALRAQWAEKDQ
jgi:bifunctional enzyme CysN/CysC